MSYSASFTNAAAISSPLKYPSGSAKFAFKSHATSSLAPLGISLSALTNLSIVKVSSGAR